MRSITFRVNSSNDPNIPKNEGIKVRVYPKLIGGLLHKLGLATLHQTPNEEKVWISKKGLYSQVVSTLEQKTKTVDQKRVQRLFNAYFQGEERGEPQKVPEIIRDIIRDYLNGKGT